MQVAKKKISAEKFSQKKSLTALPIVPKSKIIQIDLPNNMHVYIEPYLNTNICINKFIRHIKATFINRRVCG